MLGTIPSSGLPLLDELKRVRALADRWPVRRELILALAPARRRNCICSSYFVTRFPKLVSRCQEKTQLCFKEWWRKGRAPAQRHPILSVSGRVR